MCTANLQTKRLPELTDKSKMAMTLFGISIFLMCHSEDSECHFISVIQQICSQICDLTHLGHYFSLSPKYPSCI